jgi:hypothetical protein
VGDPSGLAHQKSGFESPAVHLPCPWSVVRSPLSRTCILATDNGQRTTDQIGGQPDTVGRAALLRRFSLAGDEGSTPSPSALVGSWSVVRCPLNSCTTTDNGPRTMDKMASMVKRTSSQASNLGFQVQILVEALCPWCKGGTRRCDRRGGGFESPRTPSGVRSQESGVRSQLPAVFS